MEWKAADAKDRFSELLDRAEREGPQRVLRHGKQFLIVAEEENHDGNPLIRAFLDEPEFVDIDIERINAPVREIDL